MRIAPLILAAAVAGLIPAAAEAQVARVVTAVAGTQRAVSGARWSQGVSVDASALAAAARDRRPVEPRGDRLRPLVKSRLVDRDDVAEPLRGSDRAGGKRGQIRRGYTIDHQEC